MPQERKNISQVNVQVERGPVVFGDVVYEAGGTCGPRTQPDFQLVALHSGSLDLRLDREKIPLVPGSAILLSPGHREHFLFSKEDPSRHSWCAIAPRAVPAAQQRVFRGARGPIPFTGPMAALLEIGLGARREVPEDAALEHRYDLSVGLALLCDFALAVESGGAERRNSADEALARVAQFVSRELSQPLQLADLARAAGVSRQHLLKIYRDRGRETPTEYLYAKRLEAARDWLAHTGLSVGEIADRCGFANAFHFSRKFRQSHGMSPRAWRDRHWKR